jgi:hypothetical protein
MVQAGDSLAERLQNLAAKSRPAAPETPVFEEEPHAPAKPATAPRTKAEKELLEAVKAKQKS